MNIYQVKTNISLFISDSSGYLVLCEEIVNPETTNPENTHTNSKAVVTDHSLKKRKVQCIEGNFVKFKIVYYIHFFIFF